ncbi:MAG TPA: glycogen debranching N-terminal domain-containing protein [Thermoleophilia bacterium]|nr:glycogen debranching N-terminal domain-containing protein [Thermoleophilia bacterium]
MADAPQPPAERPDEVVVGDERFDAVDREPAVTMAAERYVMSGSRAARLVLKEGDLFLYTNQAGHATGAENSVLGLYFRDTRHLSRLELLLGGREPVVLSSSAERGYSALIDATNVELRGRDGRTVPQATVHVRRLRFLKDGLHEVVRVRNYHDAPVDLALDLVFDADFADFFEVRGMRRRRRGKLLAPKAEPGVLTFAYLGLDETLRKTVVHFDPAPESIRGGKARFRLRLDPGERALVRVSTAVVGPEAPVPQPGDETEKLGALRRDYEEWQAEATGIYTDNEQFDQVLQRAQRDLRMLTEETTAGRVPVAGLPWFAAPFGRDLCLVGLETLLFDLRLAGAAVHTLAALQGRADSAFREEQPGKIMHELRRGELAALRSIPQTPYYGSVDATPLWLLLVCERTMWTGDLEAFEELGPAIDAALGWLAGDGDPDGDGFVEYLRRSRAGLVNQGWRDAAGAVVHADGTPAEGPIALAEVQGYVYYAKRRLAAIYGRLGDVERSERMASEARELKRRFNERFWVEGTGVLAMALDGEKRPVATPCSTAGHCLWSRIVSDELVPPVVRRLMSAEFFSGWGVRTVSRHAKAYNPVSFYNGGVWPFDTAIAANALKKLGYVQESNRLARGLFDAALGYDSDRLPELFCGFTRQSSERPVAFPMACSPFAASSGALLLMLQAMLGIYAQAEENIVYVHNPVLPSWLGDVTLSNLHIGHTTMHLRFRREGGRTTFSVRDKQGPGRIVIVE